MTEFEYKVRTEKGLQEKGLIEARSEKEASLVLRKKGYFVLGLQEKTVTKIPLVGLFDKISASHVTDFTRQLSIMMKAGLPLTKSLRILFAQTYNDKMRGLISDILADVEGGESFAEALESRKKYFSTTYIALIRSGEASGTLEDVLERLADNLEKSRGFRMKVKGALTYPAIIMVGMFAVMFIMMAFVFPKMTDMYKQFETELPPATQFLITVSNIFAAFWWAILIGLGGLVFAFMKWKNQKRGKAIWDRIVLKTPLIGTIVKEVILIESARTLGILISAGLPITQALEIVSETVTNAVFNKGLKDAQKDVEKGYPLGITLARNKDFPPIFAEMVTIGEETGNLDETLSRLSYFFETKSDESVKGLTTAIEPIIMVILGIGVAFLVIAIVMPIYQLTTSM